MAANRVLTKKESAYVSKNLKNTKTLVFWTFLTTTIVVSGMALAMYSFKDAGHVVINISFGILILLIGILYWVFKGYKTHVLNPNVFNGSGYYKRIYEQRGRHGAYFDTINGVKVKLPWHWRRYLKQQQNEAITYEYIVRDGAVAFNELSIYVVSVNNTLTLDYELNHGLQKVKPLSFINSIALILLLPALLIFCLGSNLNNALKISQAFQNPEEQNIVLKNAEELKNLSSSSYIKIDNAWIYQYKRSTDLYGANYIISDTERERIYNHPASSSNYRFFVDPEYITKPDKAKLKTSLKNNPLSKNTLFKNADSSIVNRAINQVYSTQFQEYNVRVKRAEKFKQLLAELKPKSYLLKIHETVFNAPEPPFYTIKKSLEKPYQVRGFYDIETGRLIDLKTQDNRKKEIKSAFIFLCICSVIMVCSLFSLIKILRNSRLKLKLVKAQLHTNDFKQLQ